MLYYNHSVTPVHLKQQTDMQIIFQLYHKYMLLNTLKVFYNLIAQYLDINRYLL